MLYSVQRRETSDYEHIRRCPYQGENKMKKALVVLMVAIMIPAAVFASRGLFDLTLGAVAQYGKGLGSLIDDIKAKDTTNLTNIKNYQFGPELRIRLAIVELDVGALINSNGATTGKFYEKMDYSGYGNVGLSFDLFFVRIGLTAGLDFAYLPQAPAGMQFIVGPSTINDSTRKELVASMSGGAADLKNWAMTAPLNIRATVDFLLGDNVTLGVYGSLPTNISIATISNMEQWKDAYEGAKTGWDKTTIGLFLGFNFL